MIYLGVESEFTPVATGPAHCDRCSAETEHVLLVAEKKAKFEIFITIAKWQSCYLVCGPCFEKPKSRLYTKKEHFRRARRHISKDAAQAFVLAAQKAA